MNGGGYAKVISDITGCEFWNTAVDGSILRQKEGSGTNYHSVSDSIVDMPTDADIYCFEGGINDYWTNAVLGTYSATDYTTELDKTTVCGALEYIFRYCINNFVGKAICFVIVHKVGNTSFSANSQGDTFKDYHDAFVGLCEKYGIPYYDAWYQSGLNGWNLTQSNAYLTANPKGTGDGTHPNRAGYERYYATQLMRLFESIVKR
jgi:lysophospholipase L1-like esterase